MELLYLCDDKRKTNIQFYRRNFDSRRGSRADVSQAKIDNSYVILKIVIDYIHTDNPF